MIFQEAEDEDNKLTQLIDEIMQQYSSASTSAQPATTTTTTNNTNTTSADVESMPNTANGATSPAASTPATPSLHHLSHKPSGAVDPEKARMLLKGLKKVSSVSAKSLITPGMFNDALKTLTCTI